MFRIRSLSDSKCKSLTGQGGNPIFRVRSDVCSYRVALGIHMPEREWPCAIPPIDFVARASCYFWDRIFSV
jgi:hypothetical protein